MNKTLNIVALTALLAATQAVARSHDGFVDRARVISSTPLYETVEVSRPVERCRNERVVHYGRDRDATAGTIAGGVVGGVLGNQIGPGSGRTAATVVGTLIGAAVGNNLADDGRDHRYVTHRTRCEQVVHRHTEERVVGYRVEYRYKGQIFVTRTDDPPGRFIRVRVDVDPLETY
jgi:uncharacterized protein YcfJ